METPPSSPDNSLAARLAAARRQAEPELGGDTDSGADESTTVNSFSQRYSEAFRAQQASLTEGQHSDDDSEGTEAEDTPEEPQVNSFAQRYTTAHNNDQARMATPEVGEAQGAKAGLGRIAARAVQRDLRRHHNPLETSAHRAVSPAKLSYARHEQDAAATATILGIHEISQDQSQSRTLKLADRLAPQGHKRADVLRELGKHHAERLIAVDETTPDPQASPEEDERQRHWAAVLDPRNILALRNHIIEKAVGEGVSRADIVWTIQADKFNKLYPVEIAHYLGVEPAEWATQRRYESEVVPSAVITKLRHIFSLPSNALEELVTQYTAAADPTDRNSGRKLDNSPILRLENHNLDFRASHEGDIGLDKQIDAARASVKNITLGDIRAERNQQKVRLNRERQNAEEVLARAGIDQSEVKKIHGQVGGEISKEARSRLQARFGDEAKGKLLPEKEFQELSQEVRERVILEELGDNPDANVVKALHIAVANFHHGRSR